MYYKDPEIWVKLIDFDYDYEISNYGNFRRILKDGTIRNKSLFCSSCGNYYNVSLVKDGKEYTYKAHRLVAEYFLPNPDNLPIVNHIDNVGKNNYYRNLQWCTHSYNSQFKRITNTDARGEKSSNAKLTNEQVLEIYELANSGDLTQKQIADMYNISRDDVKNIKLGNTWNSITGHNKQYIGALRGEDNPNSKISDRDVIDIFNLANKSNYTPKTNCCYV